MPTSTRILLGWDIWLFILHKNPWKYDTVVFFFVNLAEMAIIHTTMEANLATQKKSGVNIIYTY